jgi:hypothetical protein
MRNRYTVGDSEGGLQMKLNSLFRKDYYYVILTQGKRPRSR